MNTPSLSESNQSKLDFVVWRAIHCVWTFEIKQQTKRVFFSFVTKWKLSEWQSYALLIYDISKLLEMANNGSPKHEKMQKNLCTQLAVAVRSIQWSYGIFWSPSTTEERYKLKTHTNKSWCFVLFSKKLLPTYLFSLSFTSSWLTLDCQVWIIEKLKWS